MTGAATFLMVAAALVMLALWLARYDIARRTIKGWGLTRFLYAFGSLAFFLSPSIIG